jgi:hypothetical protein
MRSYYNVELAKIVAALAIVICFSYQAGAQPSPMRKMADLNIVAHADDDVLFMNPDMLEAVEAGRPQVTVYLTAGDFRVDDLWYAVGREQGAIDGWSRLLQIADEVNAGGFAQSFTETFDGYSSNPLACTPYAEQLSENPGTVKWQRTQLRVGARSVEIATTGDDPGHLRVMLVFLRLNASRTVWGTPMRFNLQNQDLGATTLANLKKLFNGPPETVIRSPDGREGYTKEQLLSTMVGLFELLRPAVVRTQDSENPHPVDGNIDDPDGSCDPDHGIPCAYQENGNYYDHSDHYWAARFAKEALRRYRLIIPSYRPRYSIYTGYSLEWAHSANMPPRLSTRDVCFKKSIMYFHGLNDSALINDNPSQESSPFSTFAYNYMGYQQKVAGTLP